MSTSFWNKAQVRMKAKYVDDAHENKDHELHSVKKAGAHWVPIIYFSIIFVSMWSTFAMWYINDRKFRDVCMDIYDDPVICGDDREWTFPTISYTGQRNPEWYVFSVGLSIGSVLQFIVVYYVHRRAWAAALFANRGIRKGTLDTEPRVFCIPLCCCSSAFCGGKRMRPQLKCMLKTSEIMGYISAFFLFWVGWARMTYSYELHNLVAYLFFLAGIVYLPLFTLAQHQIKKKCPAKFKSPWRYFVKVTVVTCLAIIGLTYVFLMLDLLYDSCNKWSSSMFRRTGLPVGEYLAAMLVGVYLLSHYEDIRQDNWYLSKQIESAAAARARISRPVATSNAGYSAQGLYADGVSTFAAPTINSVSSEI